MQNGVSRWAIASILLGVSTWLSFGVLFVRSEAMLLVPLGVALCAMVAAVGSLIDVGVSRGKKRGLVLGIAGLLLAAAGAYVFARIVVAGVRQALN